MPIYDCWAWKAPSHVPPSTKVRYWPSALLSSACVAALTYPVALWVAWQIPASHSLMNYGQALQGSAAGLIHLATATISLREPTLAFWEVTQEQSTFDTLMRVGGAAALAGWASGWVLCRGLEAFSNERHSGGSRLLEGKEALEEARRRSLSKRERARDPHALSIHPAWISSKKEWARHVFIHGGVGSGKTVVLKHFLNQIHAQGKRAFVYDVKGDLTAMLSTPNVAIVSPFDARSHTWDVGRDVRTVTQASAFAASIIPMEEGSGAFWASAAQAILEACVRELQATKKRDWGWADLAALLTRPAEVMQREIALYHPRAAMLLANPESNTASSVLAVLANGTAVIERLALAWPQRGERSFSMLRWIRNDYPKSKPQMVIVQSGPDEALAKAYISAMVNIAVPQIISPSLPDDESGRFLGFVFDELVSAGRLNIDTLLSQGRSKGVVFVGCVQDWSQVEQTYGEKTAQAFDSMVGTHVYCRIKGEARTKLAAQMGKRKVAWRTHDEKSVLHEDSRAVVSPETLAEDLGFRRGKAFGKERWGIRAIVRTSGDPLLLNWPGVTYPTDGRKGQIPAAWTTKGAQPLKQSPIPSSAGEGLAEIQQLLKLTADQAAAELEKRGVAPPKLRAVSNDELEAIFRK